MTLTLEDIAKEFKSLSATELAELISSNRRERSTVTTDTIKAARKKIHKKNATAAIDGLSDDLLLEVARRRKLLGKEGQK